MAERIMLIVWRWREYELDKRITTPEILLKKGFNDKNWSIANTEDDLFDSFHVCDNRPDGSRLLIEPPSRVVRTYIHNSINEPQNPCFQYLGQLIQYLKKEDNKLFVYLHRRDGFGEQEVKQVLQAFHADKCFLIGGSRDYIYHKLISDGGYFFSETAKKDKPETMVADEINKQVFQVHFEKVWEHYQHEFYTKIFELKEDLLSHFYAIFPGDQTWAQVQIHEHLAANDLLHLRLHSFISNACDCLSREQEDRLREYGKNNNKSYEFDDCYANLALQKNVEQQYNDISNLLNELFHGSSNTSTKEPLNEWLTDVEKRFSVLLQALEINT